MRWLALFLLLAPSISHGVNINDPDSISAAIDDPESFSFFYIGHGYGAHNGGGAINNLVYPHPEIIRIIDQLKLYNFGVFGGDVVEICNKQSVEAFEEFLVKPLGLPLINSIGNHDKCLQIIYGFPEVQVFTKGKNTFLIINTDQRKLDKKNIIWLREQLEKFNRQPNAKRLFIFTHRPTFMLLDPTLKEAAKYGNFEVEPDEIFTETISKTITKIDANKSIYWFAGGLGIHLPLVYHALSNNVHLIGSGVYERDNDQYLDVVIKPDNVEIQAVNFLSSEASELIEYTDPDFTARHYLSGKAFDEGWTETMLTKLYSSVGVGKGIPLKEVQIEHDASKSFDFYFLPDSNSILLSKENCGPSGNDIFYVQFHPTRIEDRIKRNRPWNGYHFYASRLGKNKNKCLAMFPLPDYPVKFIQTGQFTEGKEVWKAKVTISSVSAQQ